MFRYKIKIRPASEEDSLRECLIEEVNPDNFEIRFDAMMVDIKNIPGIMSLIRIEDEMIISTNFDVASVKGKLKPFFSRDHCHIRFVELEDVSI